MPKRILLVGGDEFRSSCERMDRHVLSLTGRDAPRVVIVPTAAAFENPALAASNGVRHFAALGASADSAHVVAADDARDPQMIAAVQDADLIYFTGGSPEHLLSVLDGSPLLDAVKAANERGAVWAGSSAGAMVLGQRMRRPSSPSGGVALGVVPGVMVLPHHERRDPQQVLVELAERDEEDLTVLGIDGGSGVLLEPDGATALGSGYVTVYRRGGWSRCQTGDALPGLSADGAAA